MVSMRTVFSFFLIVFASSLFSGPAKASSYEERKALCLNNPSPVGVTGTSAATEAEAPCLECLAGVPVAKKAPELQAAASSIEEKARIKRDLDFFRQMEAGGSFGTGETPLKQMKSQLSSKKNFQTILLASGVESGSDENKLLTMVRSNMNSYWNLPSNRRRGSDQEKFLLKQRASVTALIESKVKKLLSLADSDTENLELGPLILERLKKMNNLLSKSEDFYKVLGTDGDMNGSLFTEVYFGYSDFMPVYKANLLVSDISDLEKKIKLREEDEKKIAAEDDASALAVIEKKVFDQMKWAIEPGLCGLSAAEAWAIRNYTGSGYRNLNKALRDGDGDEKFKLYREVLNSALAKLKPYVGDVKRGTSMPENVLSQHQVGAVLTYEAFTSTSTGNGFDMDQKFIIKSASGRYVDPLSTASGEKEVIFPAGTRFKVLDVHLRSEILPTDSEDIKKLKKRSVDITMEEVP